jgi:alkylation response protein AidB-like acyl-CoA dehydrogenase
MEDLHHAHPEVGADVAALAFHALGEVMERARTARLTRHQHILLRLGELISYAECAGCLARRAARSLEGKLNEKADLRFDAHALAAISRVFAREAALKVGSEGLRYICGAAVVSDSEIATLEKALELTQIHMAQRELIADMDCVADALFARSANKAAAAA